MRASSGRRHVEQSMQFQFVFDGYMKDCIDSEGFRANVGIVISRDDGQVFLGGRVGQRGWQFPQGGIMSGESAEQALFRELHEEVGLTDKDVSILGCTQGWLRYQLPKKYQRSQSLPLCVGQKQKWYLLRLAKTSTRLYFDSTAKPEFDRWRWVDYWHPVREVIFFKRRVYAQALTELGQFLGEDKLPRQPEWMEETLRESAPRTDEQPQGE